MKTEWNRGDKAELARRAGITPSYLGDILHARKSATAALAKELACHAQALGYTLERMDFLYPSESLSDLITPVTKG